MAMWLQHLVALAVVGVCAGLVGRQVWFWWTGRATRIGNCCAKGCGTNQVAAAPGPAASQPPAVPVQFMPAEMLASRIKARRGAGR